MVKVNDCKLEYLVELVIKWVIEWIFYILKLLFEWFMFRYLENCLFEKLLFF